MIMWAMVAAYTVGFLAGWFAKTTKLPKEIEVTMSGEMILDTMFPGCQVMIEESGEVVIYTGTYELVFDEVDLMPDM